MANGPPASHLCLLSDLPLREVGEKVRFLGCVISYSPASAALILEHRRSVDGLPARALVNVDLILDRLGAQQTRVGEWVNVIGYITSILLPPTSGRGSSDNRGPAIHVQGVLVWSAGSLDVQRYEASVDTLASGKSRAGGDTAPSDALLRARR